MHSEMLDKTQRLSDELVSGLEARDRFLRSIKVEGLYWTVCSLVDKAFVPGGSAC